MSDNRPLALVTGASHGIGAELARVFAEHGHDLIVTAEDAAIGEVAERMRRHGGSAQAVQTDLSDPKGVEELDDAIGATGRPLVAAALNAGVGSGGSFVGSNLADELRLIDLNVRSTVDLAHRVLGPMVERGHGRVLVTSSIASTMPGSYQAVYNASKSFVQSFTEAVNDELRGTGVSLTSLMPGPTATRLLPPGGEPLRQHHGPHAEGRPGQGRPAGLRRPHGRTHRRRRRVADGAGSGRRRGGPARPGQGPRAPADRPAAELSVGAARRPRRSSWNPRWDGT